VLNKKKTLAPEPGSFYQPPVLPKMPISALDYRLIAGVVQYTGEQRGGHPLAGISLFLSSQADIITRNQRCSDAFSHNKR